MDYLIKASAVIALFYLCFYFFLKKETFFNHNRWFLLIGVIIALIFPFVVIPIHIAVEPILAPETAYVISENIPVTVSTPITKPQFEWQTLLPFIYGIGLAIFLIQFLFQFGSLILLLLKNPRNKDGIYTYVIVNNKISPFSFFKWIVYNPESFNEAELELMLTHEKAHANQLHSIDILLIQLACSIFWFNPLIWFYRKELRQNLEYIADYKTQEKSSNEKEYQRLLLKTSVVNHNISISNNFYNSLIKERIVMLKKSRSNRKKQWRYLLILPLMAGLLMSMNTETIYVEMEDNTISGKNTIEFVVTKNTTDDELKVMSKAVENKGGTLIFSKVKRNNNNELTNIFLKFYNRSYGGGNSNQSIDSFIIYKELYGAGGGYVGRIDGATIHFDNLTKDKKTIEELQKRAHKVIIKNGVQSAQVKEPKQSSIDHIEIVFNKNMTDKQLDDIKKELKSNGILMNIKRIKRNKKGEISDINIDFETENGSANYNVKDKDGIKSFYFNMEEDGSFGVGAINDYEIIIAEEINDDNHRKSSKSKSKTFLYNKEENKVYKVDSTDAKGLHEEHDANIRTFKSKIYNYSKNDSIIVASASHGNNPFISRDTVYISKNIFIDSSSLKNNSNYRYQYYEDNKPLEIISSRNTYEIHQPNKSKYRIYHNSINNNPKPLVIVSGKEVDNDLLGIINPDHIEQLTVLKGDDAIKTYGDKGKNGVMVIKMKDDKSWKVKPDSKENSPWRVKVNSTSYIDDNNASKKGTLAYINKYSSDRVLDKYKDDLEKFGLKVKFSKLRRNKDNEIISLKINVRNEKGNESSASYKNDDGISGIEFGELDGNLVVRTSTMN